MDLYIMTNYYRVRHLQICSLVWKVLYKNELLSELNSMIQSNIISVLF